MARPSKLTDAQWGEVLRCAAQGESQASLAKRFRVSEGTISKRVSKDLETVKTLAGTIAKAEFELDSLPVSKRIATRTLADQLKIIGENVTRAAAASSETAAAMAEAARERSRDLVLPEPDAKGRKVDHGAALEVEILQMGANRALGPAMRLIAATMGKTEPDEPDQPESMDELYDKLIG